ncbi:hypothetical protein R1flu_019938 [Riccia fluitans]|uniref:Uncharacterized protein n=1 Tax=Riccia fluitans TaxID=41844 RepID=A0ABD1ZK30_9MARC
MQGSCVRCGRCMRLRRNQCSKYFRGPLAKVATELTKRAESLGRVARSLGERMKFEEGANTLVEVRKASKGSELLELLATMTKEVRGLHHDLAASQNMWLEVFGELKELKALHLANDQIGTLSRILKTSENLEGRLKAFVMASAIAIEWMDGEWN